MVKPSSEMLHGAPADGWKGSAETGLTDTQVLSRLAIDPRDAEALIAVYEHYEVEISAAAISWFGNNHRLCEGAINNILVAIGRQVRSYDPQSMDAAEWVHGCAGAEARRLREALETAGSKGLLTGRAK